MSETNEITRELLVRIPERYPLEVRCWRNNRVKAMGVGKGGRLRLLDAGINGQGDISGIVGPWGIRLEVEVKVGKDKQNEDQKNFQAMIQGLGGIYVLATGVEHGMQALVREIERRRTIEQQRRPIIIRNRQHPGERHPKTRVSRAEPGRRGAHQASQGIWPAVP